MLADSFEAPQLDPLFLEDTKASLAGESPQDNHRLVINMHELVSKATHREEAIHYPASNIYR